MIIIVLYYVIFIFFPASLQQETDSFIEQKKNWR